MKIEVFYFDGCPSYPIVAELLQKLLKEEGLLAPVDLVCVSSHEEAVRGRFLGSPTILINGEDMEPAAQGRQDFGLKCRLYAVGGRLVGVPDEKTFREAIQTAKRQELEESWRAGSSAP